MVSKKKPAKLEGFDEAAWIEESTPKPSPAMMPSNANPPPKASPKSSPKVIPASAMDDKFRKAQLKKLRQVEELKKRLKQGDALNEDQLRKIKSESDLRKSLGDEAPASATTLTASEIKQASAGSETVPKEQSGKKKSQKERQKERKARKAQEGMTEEERAAAGPKEHVMALLKKMKPPVHVAALSVAFKHATGEKMAKVHKGGMLRFLKDELQDEVHTAHINPGAHPAIAPFHNTHTYMKLNVN